MIRRRRPFVLVLMTLGVLLSAQPRAIGAAAGGDVSAVAQDLGLRRCALRSVRVLGASAQGGPLVVVADLSDRGPARFGLDPYPLRARGFRVVVQEGGVQREASAPPPSAYHGVDRESGDQMWATVIGGRVRAVVVPARPSGLGRTYVQPLNEPGLGDASLHAVFADADAGGAGLRCGVEDFPAVMTPNPTPAAAAPPASCKVAEIVVDADYYFFKQESSSVAASVQDVETVMLGVNQIYQGNPFSPPIRFALKQITVRTTPDEPYAPVPATGGSATALLQLVENAWSGVASPTRDMVHLFTGRTLGGIAGFSFVGSACDSGSEYGWSATHAVRDLATRFTLTAHELGHTLGLTHDTDNTNLYVMEPILTSSSTFSSHSLTEYQSGIGAFHCLGNVIPDAWPDSAVALPGQSVLIDVLANDGRGAVCPEPPTSFTLPSATTVGGGAVSVSAGTGPGGRDQVLYTAPMTASKLEDSFQYSTGGLGVAVAVTVEPPRAPATPTGTVPGLSVKYYNLTADPSYAPPALPDFASLPIAATGSAADVNFTSPPSGPPGPIGSNVDNVFYIVGAVLEGFIEIPATGFWTFSTESDGASRVLIGGSEVVLNPIPDGQVQRSSAFIALAAGRHAVRVEYAAYSPVMPASLILSYSGPGRPAQVVPASAFTTAHSCKADFNGDGQRTVQDIFSFLRAYFSMCAGDAGSPCGGASADFDISFTVTPQDIFSFLAAWFAGCP